MPSKTLLIFPFDLMSHYLRCIKLASYYKEYRILFASSNTYNHYITDAGFDLFNVEKFDPDTVMECSRKFNFDWLNAKDAERVFLSQVKLINYYKPEIVIGDTSPTLKMAAEKTGVKYVALMNGYMSKYYAETRTLSRTHPGYPHLKKLPPNIANKITSFAEKIAFKFVHKPFKQLRRTYKLKKVQDYLNEMEGDENIICDDPEFFPQRKLPANYKIIGPLLYNVNNDEEKLICLLQNGKPTICVCMGSSGDWETLKFLSAEKYENINIVTAGDYDSVITGNHVLARDFINLDKLLPKSTYLICHGGNGTIYKGIQHKVFMLCLTSHFEQEWNVQMLEKLNYGISINDNPEYIVSNYFSDLPELINSK